MSMRERLRPSPMNCVLFSEYSGEPPHSVMLGSVVMPLYDATLPSSQISVPTRSTELTWSRIAWASSRVTGGHFSAARRSSSLVKPFGHFCTWKVCAPSTVISFSMVVCMTEMAVITPMMEATPSTIPTRVRNERSLLLPMAPSDIRNTSETRMGQFLIHSAGHRSDRAWRRARRESFPTPRPPPPTPPAPPPRCRATSWPASGWRR